MHSKTKKLLVTSLFGAWGIGRLAEGCYLSGAAKGLTTFFLWWVPGLGLIPLGWWAGDVYRVATSGEICHSKKPDPATTEKTKESAQKQPSKTQGGGRKSRRHKKSRRGTRKRRS